MWNVKLNWFKNKMLNKSQVQAYVKNWGEKNSQEIKF